jgi:hypothetical protein
MIQVGFEVLTSVSGSVIWNVMPLSPTKLNPNICPTYLIHIQNRRTDLKRNQHEPDSESCAVCFILISYLAYSSLLKTERIFSSETMINFNRTTRHYIPEDNTLEWSKMLLQTVAFFVFVTTKRWGWHYGTIHCPSPWSGVCACKTITGYDKNSFFYHSNACYIRQFMKPCKSLSVIFTFFNNKNCKCPVMCSANSRSVSVVLLSMMSHFWATSCLLLLTPQVQFFTFHEKFRFPVYIRQSLHLSSYNKYESLWSISSEFFKSNRITLYNYGQFS